MFTKHLTCFRNMWFWHTGRSIVSHNSFKSGQFIERACFYLSVICLFILSETFNKDFFIIIIIIIIIIAYH